MRAIIIKKIPIREYDELVICYTEKMGKQAYKARGILRPTSIQARHLDVLNIVDFNLVDGKGHPIITGAHCINGLNKLKSHLSALMAAFFVIDLANKLIMEGESDEKLWHFLEDSLNNLDRAAASNETDWPVKLAMIKNNAASTLGYKDWARLEETTGVILKSAEFQLSSQMAGYMLK